MVEDASGEEIELDDECSAAATFLELSKLLVAPWSKGGACSLLLVLLLLLLLLLFIILLLSLLLLFLLLPLSGWSAPEGCLLEEGSRVTLEAAGSLRAANWGSGKMCNAELSELRSITSGPPSRMSHGCCWLFLALLSRRTSAGCFLFLLVAGFKSPGTDRSRS